MSGAGKRRGGMEETHVSSTLKVVVDPELLQLAFTLVLALDQPSSGSILLVVVAFLQGPMPSAFTYMFYTMDSRRTLLCFALVSCSGGTVLHFLLAPTHS